MVGRHPQPNPLKPLPAPLQAANRLSCKLKSFRNSGPFHPENLTLRRSRHQELAAPIARNLLIGEKVLQFNRARHADWLKTVSRLPMPQPDRRPHLIGIKGLLSNSSSGPSNSSPRINSPRDSRPIELNLPCLTPQGRLRRTSAKLLRGSDLQLYPAQAVANGITYNRGPACPPRLLLPTRQAIRACYLNPARLACLGPSPNLPKAEIH